MTQPTGYSRDVRKPHSVALRMTFAAQLDSWPARATLAITGAAPCTWLWRLPSRDRPLR